MWYLNSDVLIYSVHYPLPKSSLVLELFFQVCGALRQFLQRYYLLYLEILFLSDKVISAHHFIQKDQDHFLPMCIIYSH